jgi:hypothetical protein
MSGLGVLQVSKSYELPEAIVLADEFAAMLGENGRRRYSGAGSSSAVLGALCQEQFSGRDRHSATLNAVALQVTRHYEARAP